MYLPLLIYVLEKLIPIVESIYFLLFSISIISINTSEYYQYQPLYQNTTSNRSFHVSYFDSLSVLMGQDFSLVLLISPTISNFENYPPLLPLRHTPHFIFSFTIRIYSFGFLLSCCFWNTMWKPWHWNTLRHFPFSLMSFLYGFYRVISMIWDHYFLKILESTHHVWLRLCLWMHVSSTTLIPFFHFPFHYLTNIDSV